MIDYKLVGGTLYIGLSGELDESTSVYLRNELDSIIGKSNMQKVVMELSELRFMDSTGIGVLLGRYRKLKESRIPIFIANPQKNIDKVLNLSGIYGIMPKIDY